MAPEHHLSLLRKNSIGWKHHQNWEPPKIPPPKARYSQEQSNSKEAFARLQGFCSANLLDSSNQFLQSREENPWLQIGRTKRNVCQKTIWNQNRWPSSSNQWCICVKISAAPSRQRSTDDAVITGQMFLVREDALISWKWYISSFWGRFLYRGTQTSPHTHTVECHFQEGGG